MPANNLSSPTRDKNNLSGTSPFTQFALAESTRSAWDRVKDKYSSDARTRTADMSDVRSGYRFIDPWSSKTIVTTVIVMLTLVTSVVVVKDWQAWYHIALEIKVEIIRAKNLFGAVEVVSAILITTAISIAYRIHKHTDVFLIDFATFKPPQENQTSYERYMRITKNIGVFSDESIEFQRKLLDRSGIGDKSYFPDAMHRAEEIALAQGNPSDVLNMHMARLESEQVMFGCIDDLFEKTGVAGKDIDILIVNCSLFNPTPSLSAMIVNKYKMKSSIKTYNLSGMGCSAGLISIELAQSLLQVHQNANCVVMSTENITQNWYLGSEKSMLITNTLFRMGGAAVLLSNKSSFIRRAKAKYKLETVVRTHSGADDLAYDSIFQMEDKDGIRGVKLSKNIMDVAGHALKKNVVTLSPLVFPFSEHVKFGIYLFQQKIMKKKMPPFVPDFHKAFKHFCIHTGGRAVLDVFENALKLTREDIEPSRFALHRFGNTSSASIWYELEFIERSGRVHSGDKVWQIAFGSGFKCNSAVWKSLRNVPSQSLDY